MKPSTRKLFLGLFFLAVGLVFLNSFRSKVPAMIPADVRSLALYDVDPRFDPNYLNLISNMRSYSPTPGQVKLIFANTADESLLIWKGACLGVAQCNDGRKYHLAISYFGEYARVLETGQRIRFVEASAVEFDRVKAAAWEEVFLPERRRRNEADGR